MESMFPVWALSTLLLSYALGLPILHGESEFDMKSSLNGTENSTVTDPTGNATHHFPKKTLNITRPSLLNFTWLSGSRGCHIFACATQDLGHRLQNGDEEAGKSTWNAWGPGKR